MFSCNTNRLGLCPDEMPWSKIRKSKKVMRLLRQGIEEARREHQQRDADYLAAFEAAFPGLTLVKNKYGVLKVTPKVN